jgi:hypothetical protein
VLVQASNKQNSRSSAGRESQRKMKENSRQLIERLYGKNFNGKAAVAQFRWCKKLLAEEKS